MLEGVALLAYLSATRDYRTSVVQVGVAVLHPAGGGGRSGHVPPDPPVLTSAERELLPGPGWVPAISLVFSIPAYD